MVSTGGSPGPRIGKSGSWRPLTLRGRPPDERCRPAARCAKECFARQRPQRAKGRHSSHSAVWMHTRQERSRPHAVHEPVYSFTVTLARLGLRAAAQRDMGFWSARRCASTVACARVPRARCVAAPRICRRCHTIGRRPRRHRQRLDRSPKIQGEVPASGTGLRSMRHSMRSRRAMAVRRGHELPKDQSQPSARARAKPARPSRSRAGGASGRAHHGSPGG